MAVPEAIRFDQDILRPNPRVLWPRLGAILVDSLIVAAITGLLSHYIPSFHLRIDTAQSTLTVGVNRQGPDLVPRIGLGTVLYVLYFMLFEAYLAATPGKLLASLRVVDLQGERVSPSRSIVRNLFRPIDAIGAYLVGGLIACLSPRHQRLGDFAAGTMVVSARSVPRVRGTFRENAQRMLLSAGVILLLLAAGACSSYFIAPQFVFAPHEALYPISSGGTVIGGGPAHVGRLGTVQIVLAHFTPGVATYRIRFAVMAAPHHTQYRCQTRLVLRWTNAVDGWGYGDFSQACSPAHRIRS